MSRKVLSTSLFTLLLCVTTGWAQCPHCGKIHATAPVEGEIVSTSTVVSQPVENPVHTVSYRESVNTPIADAALSIVNRKRRRAGLYDLQFDPTLTEVAQRKSNIRASRRITGHEGSYKGGARAEGVGHASGYSDLYSRFNTCYLYSRGYHYAGAAVSFDSGGRAYYTLLLR